MSTTLAAPGATETDAPGASPAPTGDPGSDLPAPRTPAESVEITPRGPAIDPKLLDLDDNVRTSFDLDANPDLLASIREHGVLVPIIAMRTGEGRLLVRDGQLRTLTARALNLDRVPVWVRDTDSELDEARAEIDRMIEQITVNDRRVGLTTSDRAAAIAQMLDLGASVTEVAKALQTKRDVVKHSARVGASVTARRMVDDGQLSLEQAAVIGDYETLGDTEAVQRLTRCTSQWFDYEARMIAADRARARDYLTMALPYAETGVGILIDHPSIEDYTNGGPLVRADEVLDADGNAVRMAHIDAHSDRWLVWLDEAEHKVCYEAGTDILVDPDTVDWDTLDDPEAEPAQGLRHAREIEERLEHMPTYFITRENLTELGLRERGSTTESDDPGSDSTEQGVEGEDADARRKAELKAAAEANARAEENARLARRRVVKLNQQGLAAKQERMKKVQRILARNSLPPAEQKFLTHSLITRPDLINDAGAFHTALKLLGIEAFTSRQEFASSIEKAKPGRAQVIALALILGGFEARTEKSLWRYSDSAVRSYLGFLREHGHHDLVPVELAALGELDPDTIDIDTPVTAAADTAAPIAA